MPQFVIAGLRPDRWLVYPAIKDLPPGQLQADVFRDFRVQGNELSVFEPSATVSPERIAIAVAAGRETLDRHGTSHTLFDRAGVEARSIPIRKTPGQTPDDAVNALHYDLIVGTAANLLALAEVISQGSKVAPILPKGVETLLKSGIQNGQLDAQRIPKRLRETLGIKV